MKTILTALLLFPFIGFSQTYTPGKKVDLRGNNYLGKTFNQGEHDEDLLKIRNAESFEELPEYFEIMHPESHYRVYRVVEKEDFVTKERTFSLQLTDIQGGGSTNIFSEEIGVPVKVYHAYRSEDNEFIDLYKYDINFQFSNPSYTYFAIEDKPFESGLMLIQIRQTMNRPDERSGTMLVEAYFDKIEKLQKRMAYLAKQKRMREIEVQDSIRTVKQHIEDSIRNAEYEKAVIAEELQSKEAAKQRKKALIKKYGQTNGMLIFENKVKIGFTKEMCIAAWGHPDDINRTILKDIVDEQWVYERSDYNHQYLYLRNGTLTTIQD